MAAAPAAACLVSNHVSGRGPVRPLGRPPGAQPAPARAPRGPPARPPPLAAPRLPPRPPSSYSSDEEYRDCCCLTQCIRTCNARQDQMRCRGAGPKPSQEASQPVLRGCKHAAGANGGARVREGRRERGECIDPCSLLAEEEAAPPPLQLRPKMELLLHSRVVQSSATPKREIETRKSHHVAALIITPAFGCAEDPDVTMAAELP
ncbi:hypothetical protein HPB47_020546 [Ixodes persulcatus]|uniref:Uncharacterized protein n=1 Tax=Ixodes persulcatus TaxID=34615 RepID=A0AC60QF88_IXOPE|nr:hypothetical protein HPB47_020546 [Ixodes persulcatus]